MHSLESVIKEQAWNGTISVEWGGSPLPLQAALYSGREEDGEECPHGKVRKMTTDSSLQPRHG